MWFWIQLFTQLRIRIQRAKIRGIQIRNPAWIWINNAV
jgi:hypothetical protein